MFLLLYYSVSAWLSRLHILDWDCIMFFIWKRGSLKPNCSLHKSNILPFNPQFTKKKLGLRENWLLSYDLSTKINENDFVCWSVFILRITEIRPLTIQPQPHQGIRDYRFQQIDKYFLLHFALQPWPLDTSFSPQDYSRRDLEHLPIFPEFFLYRTWDHSAS